jgi:DNA ligase (NAD+)
MNRIEELVKIITKAQNDYYSGDGESDISDAEFDAYWDELKNLDPNNKLFTEVGSDLGESNGFPKCKHNIIMGSQSKANTAEEMDAYIEKCSDKDSMIWYKMDGSSVVLDYINGLFIRGASRGDGTVGVDYTENIRKMGGVIQNLVDKKFTGSVRGEVLLSKSNKEKYFKDAPNCRNMATGIFHHIDGSDCEKLDVLVYDVQYLDKSKSFGTQVELASWLEAQGFKVAPHWLVKNITGEKAMEQLTFVWESDVPTYDYDIDGLVFKMNTIDMNDITTNYRPTTQIALKPARTLAKTTLKNIEWQVRNGTLTPVAILEPIELLGATITKASLGNLSIIVDLGLEIGHEVTIARCGEIIPKILKDNVTGKIAKGYEASFK